MKRRFSTEAGMLIFICLLVVIVSFSGIITYQKLISLTADLEKDNDPNNKIAQLKQISADLYATESNVRAYYFTRDSLYIKDYDASKTNIENRLSMFDTYVQNNQMSKPRADSIKSLVHARYEVMDAWLLMDRDEKVTKELAHLPQKLNQKKEENHIEDTADKRRKNNKKDAFDYQLLKTEVWKVQQKQTNQLRELNQKELLLNMQNNAINIALRNLISQMEKEDKSIQEKSKTEAIKKANTTNFIIAAFCASSVFLLVLIGVILFRYIIKTRDYNLALKTARLEAENLAQAKQNFLANMTHEIRTPINAIIGFTEQLDKSITQEPHKEQIQIIKKSSIHLLKIVNDVLDYSKLQAGKFSFEKIIFNPADTIQEVIDILLPEAENKRIKIYFEKTGNIPESLLGDPFRLQQILLNIIGNAIKFTGSGSIYVAIGADRTDAREVFLKMEIKDTGVGIPAHKVDKVFDDFEQADTNIDRRFKGTGLGLSITKKLVENQQGSIHIISKEGEGTVVHITIPYEVVNETRQPQKTEKLADASFLANHKILVVDDEPFNRKLLKTILNQWGATVEEAHDGENALHLVKKRFYDLVLMDIRMPGMTGIEITQRIRVDADPVKRKMVIIALTASNDQEKEKKCLEAGMNAFLSKPFTEQELFSLIRKVLPPTPSAAKNDIKEHIDELYRLGNGDSHFVQEMVALFIKGAEESLRNIQQAYQAQNWQAIQDATHKVAPSCRHIGAIKMLELVKDIEKIAGNGSDKGNIGLLISQLETESAATIVEVKKYLI